MDGRCRVCMAVAADVVTERLATDSQFRFCTQLQANNVRLCQKCNSDLQVAYAFRLQALLADEVMRGSIPDTYVGADVRVSASSAIEGIDTKPRQSNGDTKLSTTPGGPMSLKCEFCSKSFTRRYILNNHRRLHTGEKPYSCAYCASSFTSKLTLNRHSAQKHGSRASQGKMSYKNRDSMKMQRRLHPSESIHKCGKCHKKFLSADGLHTHIHEKHTASDEGEQVQPVQTESPKLSEDLSGGGVIGTSFSCEFCGKDFKRKSILMIHRRLHTGEKPFSCDQCDGTFITRDRLKLHKVRLHASGLSLSENKACGICGKRFKRYDYLRVHSLSCGQSSPRAEQVIINKTNGSLNFQCEFCSKAFNRQRSLMIHRRLHTGEKPYSCDICPLHFRTEESLNRHKVKVHIEDGCKDGVSVNVVSSGHQAPADSGLRHQCEFCQKFFTRRAILERHRRLHTGERPYQCRDCDSAFISSDALRAHRVRNHSGEVTPLESSFLDMLSLTCEYCNKSFTRPANLKIHRRQHTGERPYSCSMCHCTFKILDSLNRHKVREHMRSHDGITIKGDCIICYAGEVKCVAENAGHCDLKETRRLLEFDDNQEYVEESIQQGEAADSLEQDINPGDFLVLSQIDSDSGLHVEPTYNETQQIHKCKTCGKFFAQVSSLQRHERSHTLKRPFTCEFCEKKFTRACVLNIHRRLHTGELPYDCAQCSEAFRTKEGLQRHVVKQHKS